MKIWLRFLLLWLTIGLGPGPALAALIDQPDHGLRCLFLVETSLAMAGQKEAITSAITARIVSGLDGQMRAEELFTIWTYDQDVSTHRYLPAAWNRRISELLAAHLARALEDQPFVGQAQLDRAMPELFRVIAASDTLSILIINNGARVAIGTRFDEKINAAYRQHAGNTPGTLFLTTLLTRSGKVIGWSVEPLQGAQNTSANPRGPEPTHPPTGQTPGPPSVVTASASVATQNPVHGELSLTNRIALPEEAPRAQNHPKVTAKTLVSKDIAPSRSNAPATAQEQPKTGAQESQPASGLTEARGPATGPPSEEQAISRERPAETTQPVVVQPTQKAPHPTLLADSKTTLNRPTPGQVERSSAMEDRSLERLPEPPKRRRADWATQFAVTALPERPSSPRTYLMIGVGLVGLAVFVFFYIGRLRSGGRQSSLISKSLQDRK